ncbi:hypothetical protein K438DRAFT_1968585 [Mycena galopus ATCC 62051]|nr:hypothetical protein K438DRAFT_1968585 [Mycena galopus ATCC 62051]
MEAVNSGSQLWIYFCMEVPDFDDFIQRLASVTSTTLSTITAQLPGDPRASRLRQTLSVVRARLAAAPTAEVKIENLGPITPVPLLTCLTLRCDPCVAVDDALPKTMMTASPSLRALHLAGRLAASTPPRLTLSGLVPLAAHCTQLATYSVRVDATTMPAGYFSAPSRPVYRPIVVV